MKTKRTPSWIQTLSFTAAALGLLLSSPVQLQAASKTPLTLEKLYAHILALRNMHSLCDEVAPQRKAVNKVVMQEFAKKHSLKRIEAHYANPAQRTPLMAAIKDRFEKIGIPAMRKKFKKNPQACSALPVILDEYVAKAGVPNLGSAFDALRAPSGAAASQVPSPPANTASSSVESGLNPDSEKKILDIYTTASVFRTTVKQCGKTFRNTKAANTRAWDAYSRENELHAMTRLVEVEYAQRIEKLKPLIPAFAKRLLEEDPEFCRNIPGYFAKKASPFRKEHPDLYRRAKAVYPAYFAVDKAQPVIARTGKPSALLNDENKIIYAETPRYHLNALTVSGYFDDDFKYLDKKKLETDGRSIQIKGKPYRYVAPLPEGTTIEGVFKRSGGAVGVGVVAIKSKTIRLEPNGRYSTSASSGVVANAPAGVGNRGSSSRGEGSYRISGYTLELRPDDGEPEKIAFFPYHNRVFWPKSKKSEEHIGFLNIGGKIYVRQDKG